ncbi:ABC-three component system middle component 2 [Enterovibrio sp. 27052020O]|uniref:ABC-three component system middle component 2 n=1 Tax=Enterovibrio sp. 27052020O TaxID=3241166 RepID=UPI003890A251
MSNSYVFNSPLEAGVRTVCFLDSYFPRSMDFDGLMKVDFIIVHSGDFGGPDSLHPNTPNRNGEYYSRREKVRTGLDLMKKFGLIEVEYTKNGIAYKASENASPYLELMRSNYSLSLRRISNWLTEEINKTGFEELNITLVDKVF